MEIILDELIRSQKYHIRQQKENLDDIRLKEESIKTKQESITMLKEANKKHEAVIKAIDEHIEKLKAERGE